MTPIIMQSPLFLVIVTFLAIFLANPTQMKISPVNIFEFFPALSESELLFIEFHAIGLGDEPPSILYLKTHCLNCQGSEVIIYLHRFRFSSFLIKIFLGCLG
jgi:hypothetical protein